MPLILSNPVYEKAVKNTYDLYELIRKKLTLKNRIGINLLVYRIFSIEDPDIVFSKINMTGGTREEEVEFQKAKIDIILNKISIEDAIIDFIEEKQIEMNLGLLQRFDEDIIHEDDYLFKMSLYFQNPKFSYSTQTQQPPRRPLQLFTHKLIFCNFEAVEDFNRFFYK